MKLAPYPKYKPSSVEWVGEIPEDWGSFRLRFVSKTSVTKKEVRELDPETNVSFVPMEAVGEYGGLDLDVTKPLSEVVDGYTYFRNGDVIVAKITPCFENGKGALASRMFSEIGFGTTELHVLRPSRHLDARFLLYLTFSDHFRRIGTASMFGAGGQKRISDDFIRNFRHPVPSLSEQRAIAAFLDRETARIDGLVERNERLIELLQEKSTALITRAVTRGLDPNVAMKDSGVEWLGEIPAHWDPARLWRLCTTTSGATPTKENPAYWNGEVPWVSPKDMKRRVIATSEDLITQQALDETGIKLITPHVVLVVVRGMILAHSFPVAVTSVPVTINQDMKALRLIDGFEPFYFAWALDGLSVGIITTVVEEAAHGTRAIRMDQWRNLIVPVPPRQEQRAITAFLDRETTKIHALIAKVRQAIDHLKEFRTALVSAAVTGKIDVREEAS